MTHPPGAGDSATTADHASSKVDSNFRDTTGTATAGAAAFIVQWRGITACELVTAQSFFTELCVWRLSHFLHLSSQ